MSHNQPAEGAQLTHMLGKFWTVANMLSLARLVLVGPITYLILTDGPLTWLFGLVVLAVVTDWFDGRVARWSKTVSEWGKVLDPMADKFAAAAVVLALAIKGTLPVWFLAAIVTRDIIIVGGGVILARRTGRVVMSVWMGKVAVTALAITILAALMRADEPVLQACVWITTGLLLYSFVLYAIRFTKLLRLGPVSSSEADSEGDIRMREEAEQL